MFGFGQFSGQCAHGVLWVHPCAGCGRPDYSSQWTAPQPVHVQVGDPPGTAGISGSSFDSWTCSCACERCLSGSCCRFTAGAVLAPQTFVAGGTGMRLWPMDADGNPLVGYWRCACGTVVPPDREHRCPVEEDR